MDLITAAEAEQFLEITDGAGGDVLGEIITDVSARMAVSTGRTDWGGSSSRTEYHHGGRPYLLPKYLPVTSVTSVNDDPEYSWGTGTALTANDDYHISSGDNLIWCVYGSFMDGHKSVKLVYTGGYSTSTIPAALKSLCKVQVKHEWDVKRRPGKGSGDEFGVAPGQILPQVMEGLLHYTPRVPFH